ncbi:MAG: hypothetical protein PHR77_18970 [Kiritimatiellae bacterium]|nr:hypothetical protein [Kiritimatiellia bacterium]MDD5522840.1 hypothetical protein [Kiritimatiellia bacterium]
MDFIKYIFSKPFMVYPWMIWFCEGEGVCAMKFLRPWQGFDKPNITPKIDISLVIGEGLDAECY